MSKRSPLTSRKQARCARLAELLDDRLFKALGDPRRIAILARVAESAKPCTVSETASCCPTDFSVVSRHLAILRDAKILSAEKRGREVYYSVRCPELVATLRALADGIEQCCAPKEGNARR